MTNHWLDLRNSDVILIMGSNAAECHPISFKHVTKSMEKGGKLIHVDPRFTRTSAKAHIFAQLRSGTDIAFLGGMINYILENDLAFKEYVVNYTNASFIVGPGYDFKDGMFSGFNPATRSYDRSKWAFVLDEKGVPRRDDTLSDPRCVYQLLKKHYERYTLKNVSDTTGTPQDSLLEVYKTFASTGKPDKSGTCMYALGWTQHTVGVQNIRAMAMVQLLLGNIGVAGGGVNALRGESNVQGATDHALLYNSLPGYFPVPLASDATYADYLKKVTPVSKDPMSLNWKKNSPKYVASLLKAMYKDVEPAQAYDWLPKLEPGQDASWLVMFDEMLKGRFKGLFAWGMNPAVSSANAGKARKALEKLDWMVGVNLFENETTAFWKGPGVAPKKIKTEVFLLPACMSVEKEGSVTNSGRWMQWRVPGPAPLGECKPDGEIMRELAMKLQALYRQEGGPVPEPILGLNWEGMVEKGEYSPQATARLINGSYTRDVTVKLPDGTEKTFKAGTQVQGFADLRDDGSTTSGCWIYCGSYVKPDPATGNLGMRHSRAQTPEQARISLYPNWTWAWPMNRRIMYNRASVDRTGKPYAPQKPVLAWDGKAWSIDVVDGGGAPGAIHPFIMQTHGMGQIYGPGLLDGPFPEHYEPMDCPVSTQAFSSVLNAPSVIKFAGEPYAQADPRYPLVCTTYRLTEHWQSGILSRNMPWLVETEPQLFCEMSEELAKERGIKNGEKIWVESIRGKLWAVAMVTKRMKPMKVQGKTVHQVGLPWQFGWAAPKNGGDAANLLSASVGEPNTGIPETKAFMVNVRKA